jgi:hypothetical protein
VTRAAGEGDRIGLRRPVAAEPPEIVPLLAMVRPVPTMPTPPPTAARLLPPDAVTGISTSRSGL